MKFVLNEYLSSLKEDGELDSFVKQLIQSMGYIPKSKIQRGRQYGVDISATGIDTDSKKKLFLFVIKQGNFSRKNWDSGNINDIRPSITEILDVYLTTRVEKPYDKLPKKIIVCCNGEMETTVQENWAQFVNKHSNDTLEFDFWGVQHLVSYVNQHQIHEQAIAPELFLNFRRALSFIDLPDYDLTHFYKFINTLLPISERESLTQKQILKKMLLINLCMNIVHKWCEKSDNLKPSYIASERIILATFNWLIRNDFIKKRGIFVQFYSMLQSWQSQNIEYFKKVAKYLTLPESLGIEVGNFDEYCLITFEQIGILSMIGIFELWECTIQLMQKHDNALIQAKNAFDSASFISEILVTIIENNPSSLSPIYDEHCIEINMGLVLLYETGFFGPAIKWIKEIINRIILNAKINKFFPLFVSDPTKLGKEKIEVPKSSQLISFLAEWALILKQSESYNILREFIEKELPNLDLQLWFPDKDVEKYLYSEDASQKAGSTMVNASLSKNLLLINMHIAEERVLINEEKDFSYNQFGLQFIPFLSSRHFRTYPFPNSWRDYLRTDFCFNKSENL
ncbi:MAG TPA: hypothetical protein VN721_16115 [Flavipsychrobacter sp.]|nr:hypothetical protein [Flavipsychrobacter sp.]